MDKDIFSSTHELCEELKEYPEDDVLRAEAEGRKEVFLAWKEYEPRKFIGSITGVVFDSPIYEKIDAAIKEIQEALK